MFVSGVPGLLISVCFWCSWSFDKCLFLLFLVYFDRYLFRCSWAIDKSLFSVFLLLISVCFWCSWSIIIHKCFFFPGDLDLFKSVCFRCSWSIDKCLVVPETKIIDKCLFLVFLVY